MKQYHKPSGFSFKAQSSAIACVYFNKYTEQKGKRKQIKACVERMNMRCLKTVEHDDATLAEYYLLPIYDMGKPFCELQAILQSYRFDCLHFQKYWARELAAMGSGSPKRKIVDNRAIDRQVKKPIESRGEEDSYLNSYQSSCIRFERIEALENAMNDIALKLAEGDNPTLESLYLELFKQRQLLE